MLQEELLEKGKPQSNRKTRTLYVREEDQEIWDQAKDIIGDSLSTHITNHLKSLVVSKKAALLGYERIVLRFTHERIPQAKAFYGQWIIPPQNPFETTYDGSRDFYAVAETAKGHVVIFNFLHGAYDDQAYRQGFFHVFDSIEVASKQAGIPEALISEVMKLQGINIQELDI